MNQFVVDKFDIIVNMNKSYIIGHAEVTKAKSDIQNFVSNTFRLVRFLDGQVEWKIDEDIYTYGPGDVIIFSNLIKRNIHKVLSKTIHYEFFDFFPFIITNEKLRNIFYQKIYKVTSTMSPAVNKIYFLMDSLKEEMRRKNDSFKIFSIQHYLDLLILEFSRNNTFFEIQRSGSLERIAKSIHYIQQNLTKPLRITHMADICGYSPEYFTRIFKNLIGIPPKKYIINLRIEKVLHEISTKNINILDAALESGFQSSSSFYKAFNTYKSASPLKYIRTMT